VSANLTGMANNAVAMADDRLRNAAESWTADSARRLHEHGQSLIESLTRTTDQAVRESASRIFEHLAGKLRQHETGANPPVHGDSAAYSQDPPPDLNPQPPQLENYSS
jgi:hypothetical protein